MPIDGYVCKILMLIFIGLSAVSARKIAIFNAAGYNFMKQRKKSTLYKR
jgi:hypothetical protein